MWLTNFKPPLSHKNAIQIGLVRPLFLCGTSSRYWEVLDTIHMISNDDKIIDFSGTCPEAWCRHNRWHVILTRIGTSLVAQLTIAKGGPVQVLHEKKTFKDCFLVLFFRNFHTLKNLLIITDYTTVQGRFWSAGPSRIRLLDCQWLLGLCSELWVQLQRAKTSTIPDL